ncbi:hypothetical protein BDF20DRAFT_147129 [Mycotypha africana]|uniref:uncharacterized protein n=1 Tax=Mycotypha africana TaxID=64632 RepID=UPI00230149AE|nr:uncharacterized protein BDF20DRAFT_147129 [Mycotypha africana]KAI8969145.1 hypothetical protein BDF20DRAFT_147129 [Mycotypha africana]
MFRKSVSIDLVEPTVCLRGDPKDKHAINILRGVVRLRLPHSLVVHDIVVQFVGVSKTLWPEAIQQWDRHILVDIVIPICKDSVLLKKGIHTFPFEIPLSNALSESIECGLGSVRYKLHCQVHVKPRFLLVKSILQTQRPIVLVRLPSLENQQQCIIQTHLINETGGQLTLMLERAHLIPGINVPISLYFNQQCNVYAVDQMDVKLVERQKYRAPLKQTTRILHQEITLSSFVSTFEVDQYNIEMQSVYTLPERKSLRLRASTSHPHIRVRHWIQITLILILQDGSLKELQMNMPVTLSLKAMDDYLNLPVYDRPPREEETNDDIVHGVEATSRETTSHEYNNNA